MYLVLFVLHDTSKLDDVLSAWEGQGVQRITVFLSTGLGRMRYNTSWRDDLPLIPSLEDFYRAESRFNRTLMTVVRGQEEVERLLRVTTAIVGDLSKPNTGILLVLPIVQAFGLEKEEEQ